MFLGFKVFRVFRVYWGAAKELNLSYFIGETILIALYIYLQQLW